ncbi:MAG: phosphatase PAP2 family protein [Alphaproteobacteria bacterium]|nr:phosphatase PAP2 family protein [Alphaproteobacteria bacterium]
MPKTNLFCALIMCACATTSAYADSTLETLGNMTQVIVPAYAAGLAIAEPGWTGAKQFAAQFVATEVTALGLKTIINEERPDKSDKNSFPSTHTAAAFSGAFFIHRRYGWKQALAPYALAGFTAFTRINERKHYFHDCLAGAAIAALYNWAFVDALGDGSVITVSGDTHGAQLNFNMRF